MSDARAMKSGVRARMAGMTLIELMISLVIGLVVLGAVAMIFLSSNQAYRTTDGLGKVQENMQFGFEMMARDIREAGGNPCDIDLPVANVADQTGTNWWSTWSQPVAGYDNGALAGSAAGTDALQLLLVGEAIANVSSHAGTVLTVDAGSDFATNDVLMVCDTKQLAVFRAGTVGATSVSHSNSGNCSDSLNVLPAPCDAAAPAYVYPRNSVVSRLNGVRWFIADNGRGGRSLFRVLNGAGREEMVEGVSDMQLAYLQDPATTKYVAAGAVASWQDVSSIRITFTVNSDSAVGVGNVPLSRQLEYVVTVRSRAQ